MSASLQGKVLRATRFNYEVSCAGKVLTCTLRGKVAAEKTQMQKVKVGDDVRVALLDNQTGAIEEILPRKNQLSRTIASRAYREHIIAVNIDQLMILMATKKPAFKSGLLDRYLIIAEKNSITPIICLNKIDLATADQFETYRQYYGDRLGIKFLFTSATARIGLDDFQQTLANNVTALVGFSGVGKSSLINAIHPDVDIRVGEISDRTSKGQHTTTHVELFPIDANTFVVDTPGIRELGFWNIFRDDLATLYPEIRQYAQQCQFGDCKHLKEPGCAVKKAVENKDFLEERYENFVSIYHSLRKAAYEKQQ